MSTKLLKIKSICKILHKQQGTHHTEEYNNRRTQSKYYTKKLINLEFIHNNYFGLTTIVRLCRTDFKMKTLYNIMCKIKKNNCD